MLNDANAKTFEAILTLGISEDNVNWYIDTIIELQNIYFYVPQKKKIPLNKWQKVIKSQ